MTNTVRDWLAEFEDMGPPGVDALFGEGWAIFPRGLRRIGHSTDILGNEKSRLRAEFAVKLHCKKDPRGNDPGVEPRLERLAQWVRTGAPRFGSHQTVRLENARLAAQTKEDMARYEASLIFEFEQ